jgi:ribosomal protein L6P/L9E
MDKLKLLLLTPPIPKDPLVDSDHTRLLLSSDIPHLDYVELYYSYGFNGAHNYIREYIDKNGINSIFYLSSPWEFYFDVPFFEKLRKENFLVMLTGDTSHYYEVRDQYYAQAMDLVITGDFIAFFKLREIGINSITWFDYFDLDRYQKNENLPKDIEVSFIGQTIDKVGRSNYINYLLENNINMEVFGANSSRGRVSHKNKIEIFNRTKINLNFSGLAESTRLTRNYSIYKRKKQITGRTFEITMCGGFVLCEYAYGIENLFEISKEIEIFHDKKELLDKIRYYLEHEEERENIARRGYERAIKDRDAKLLIPKLIATIDELRKKKIYKPSEIYLDEEFIRNYTTYRVLLIIRFIKAGKWKFAFEEFKIILKYRKLDLYQIRVFFIEEFLDPFPRIKLVLKAILERNKK